MNLAGKKIAVLGLGKDGLSLVQGLAAAGAEVIGFGTAGSEAQKEDALKSLSPFKGKLVWEPIAEDGLQGFDGIVFSSRSGQFHAAKDFASNRGIPVLSDLDFVAKLMQAPIIGVTGTNGKTTTVSLIKAILEKGGRKVSTTGGDFDEWGKRISDKKKYDFHLFELSSTRLEQSSNFAPHIAVLLNIFPSHAERHEGGLPAYLEAKAKIFAQQKPEDFLVHEASAINIRELLRKKAPLARRIMFSLEDPIEAPGVFRENNQLVWLGLGEEREVFPIAKATNKSPLFLLNFMAALAVGRLCGIPSQVIESVLERFPGLPHRLEEIRTVEGVKFVDDARSTNLGATVWALSSFNRPIWLIMGGAVSSNTDFALLKKVSAKHVKGIFVLGSQKDFLVETLRGETPILPVESTKQAVEKAYAQAQEKDVVLFSPACPPDIVTQGEGVERGEEFRNIVMQLPEISRRPLPKNLFTKI